MSERGPLYPFYSLGENLKGFLLLVYRFSNWYGFVAFRSGLWNSAVLKPRDGSRKLNSIALDRNSSTVMVSYDGKIARFCFNSTRQLDNTMRNIYQDFIQEQYHKLRVRNKTVVDIGANNGDTAIYFAVRGASRVYAYEPYPSSYKLAERNVKSNKLANRIKLRNEAVRGSYGSISVDENYESVSNSILRDCRRGKRIGVVSLDSIVEKNKIRNAVLKIDCEGDEYGIIASARESTLKSFSQIAIEYHFGYEKIVERLRKLGFLVEHTRPKVSRNSETGGLRMDYGMIYASR